MMPEYYKIDYTETTLPISGGLFLCYAFFTRVRIIYYLMNHNSTNIIISHQIS